MQIACCNVVYKVISKLLASRINEVLPYLVSKNQSAFVQGRSIMTNVLLCQDLVHNYHRKGGSPRCMMKLYLQKAYDTFRWQFLFSVLTLMNFPAQFVNWIKVCLTSSRFSIIINGLPCGYFEGKRGLRLPISICSGDGGAD